MKVTPPHMKSILTTLAIVALVTYFGGVFLSDFGRSTRNIGEKPYLLTLRFGCELSKFNMGPIGEVPAQTGYHEDANPWLWESHESLMYGSEVLLDPKCVGALLADLSGMQNPLVVLIYDRHRNKTLYRIEKK